MNKEQVSAIKQLEAAFRKCMSSGLRFSGMDQELLYATDKACVIAGDYNRDHDGIHGVYCDVAQAQQMSKCNSDTGTVNTHGCYDDSGGY